MGPTHELLLGENFFIRPGIQLQHWVELFQDRLKQSPNGDDGEYQLNSFVRRGRVFFSGGILKKVTFLILFEAANIGRTATAADGTASKTFNTLTM
ncbi:MAG TPA: hypothetical protein VEL05_06285, partial [Candidatus Acidoferrum sp.]|nr:hypothetical protein [Candidatus Acidoferrum sp.]